MSLNCIGGSFPDDPALLVAIPIGRQLEIRQKTNLGSSIQSSLEKLSWSHVDLGRKRPIKRGFLKIKNVFANNFLIHLLAE